MHASQYSFIAQWIYEKERQALVELSEVEASMWCKCKKRLALSLLPSSYRSKCFEQERPELRNQFCGDFDVHASFRNSSSFSKTCPIKLQAKLTANSESDKEKQPQADESSIGNAKKEKERRVSHSEVILVGSQTRRPLRGPRPPRHERCGIKYDRGNERSAAPAAGSFSYIKAERRRRGLVGTRKLMPRGLLDIIRGQLVLLSGENES